MAGATRGVNETREQAAPPLLAREQAQLLDLVLLSIRHYLDYQAPLALSADDYPTRLHHWQSSFVTLHLEQKLRGCIGSLQASRPLFEDVAHNARSAAFSDPRFPALEVQEFTRLELHVSVLNAPQALPVLSLQKLLQQLRPGVDGVILEERGHRATFLPSVWEQLPRPELFIAQLRRKAGLDPSQWSEETRVSVYTVEDFSS